MLVSLTEGIEKRPQISTAKNDREFIFFILNTYNFLTAHASLIFTLKGKVMISIYIKNIQIGNLKIKNGEKTSPQKSDRKGFFILYYMLLAWLKNC